MVVKINKKTRKSVKGLTSRVSRGVPSINPSMALVNVAKAILGLAPPKVPRKVGGKRIRKGGGAPRKTKK